MDKENLLMSSGIALTVVVFAATIYFRSGAFA